MPSATFAPTPCTVSSSRNQSRSAVSVKPYRVMASSRTCVSISTRATAGAGGSAESVRVEACTR